MKVGDKVEIKGDSQDYILKEPDRIYSGKIIGKEGDDILISLDTPVNTFTEVWIFESSGRITVLQ